MYPQDDESDIALDKSWAEPGDIGYDDLPDPLIVGVDLDGDGYGGDQCIDTSASPTTCASTTACSSDPSSATVPPCSPTDATRSPSPAPPASPASTRTTRRPRLQPTESEMDQIRRASLMLPNWSTDIGLNNASPDQDVHLRAIIAGVIDIRGNARIDGVLIADFQPVFGEPPLQLYGEPIGNPADFNITSATSAPKTATPKVSNSATSPTSTATARSTSATTRPATPPPVNSSPSARRCSTASKSATTPTIG